tara:strand:- start:1566 stop:1697 length:132 start_codon:yes stop_codon:yes gene_type:complete
MKLLTTSLIAIFAENNRSNNKRHEREKLVDPNQKKELVYVPKV